MEEQCRNKGVSREQQGTITGRTREEQRDNEEEQGYNMGKNKGMTKLMTRQQQRNGKAKGEQGTRGSNGGTREHKART